jgi:SPP1 gp7 family putative phage head morphogenesis protein
MVRGVVGFNRRELNRVFEATIGVGLNPLEPFLDDSIAAATRENVRRITALVRSELDQAEETILSGFRQGLRHTEIMERISDRFHVVESRAKLIARDQVSKLNGELTRLRQTSVGVTKYIWRTSQDERVRETHQEFDGNEYSWETGSPEGHPGEPINCRCVAEPVLTDLLAETESAALESEVAGRRAA